MWPVRWALAQQKVAGVAKMPNTGSETAFSQKLSYYHPFFFL
jgi:hypothetical protein